MHLSDLKLKHVTELVDMAIANELEGANRLRKQELVFALLKHQAKKGEAIFGDGGGARLAEEAGVALFGKLPLDTRVRAESDSGRPTVIAAPDSQRGQAYFEMARRTAAELARRPRDRSSAFPGIVVERAS
jgi:hypothetical protein